MDKVYVIQEPLKRNPRTGEMETFMDLTPAAAYGDIEIVLSRGSTVLSPGPMIHELKRKLSRFTKDDFLLLIGDTGAIAAASMVASNVTGGQVKILKWNRDTKSYISLKLEV